MILDGMTREEALDYLEEGMLKIPNRNEISCPAEVNLNYDVDFCHSVQGFSNCNECWQNAINKYYDKKEKEK